MQFTTDDFDVSTIQLPENRKINGRGKAAHLPEAKLNELFNALPEQWQPVFAVAYFTGARISEALTLEAKDIHDDRIIFSAKKTKTKKDRHALIHPVLRSVLTKMTIPAGYMPDGTKGYLFPATHHHAKRGTALTRQAAHNVLRKTCDELWGEGHGVSTHSSRRSFATNLAAAGVPPAKISKLLGHKEACVTDRYIG